MMNLLFKKNLSKGNSEEEIKWINSNKKILPKKIKEQNLEKDVEKTFKYDLLFQKFEDNKKNSFPTNWNHNSNAKLNSNEILYKNDYLKYNIPNNRLSYEMNKDKGIMLPEIKYSNFCMDVNGKIVLNQEKILHLNNVNSQRRNWSNQYKNNSKKYDFKTINSVERNTPFSKINRSSKKLTLDKDFGQYELGVISGGRTTNNEIIIPILTDKRSYSKGNNLNESLTKKHSDEAVKKYILKNFQKKFKKISSKNNNEKNRRYNVSMKYKEFYDILSTQKNNPNFHKIKIEKGINNIKLGNFFAKTNFLE